MQSERRSRHSCLLYNNHHYMCCFTALKVKLLMRRPRNQLEAQGIMPRMYNLKYLLTYMIYI